MPNSSVEKTLKIVKEYPLEIGVRALGVMASLTFFYYFPMFVFITYMGHKGFFSYDMFSAGRIGLDSFYMASEMLTIVLSLYLAGFLTLLMRRHTARNPELAPPYKSAPIYAPKHRWQMFGTFVVNVALIALLAYQIIAPAYQGSHESGVDREQLANAISLLVGIIAISCWVAMHIGVVIYQRAKQVFASLGIGVALLIGVCLVMPQTIAKMLDGSLQYFGVGGGLPLSILIEDGQQTRRICSKLILLTPTQVFAASDPHEVMIFDRSRLTGISIDNHSAFHRGK
ncbi:hypothetical protein [Burkholderia ubonensis]|uniref:hypothetical protein n=1 Tax=Burkholderia ubonensis TaxID=101571 RepID=UPI00075C26BD|nr:hypothetical protein [Burkholderia ubonensis]KVP36552.1 hypothetical protein WJ88_05745 [Burkholderia ubonensis]KWB52732.1 hypothetical protein WL37_06215 [Burkholderia ubonensis]KWB79081.1 hypothetical protein WL42_13820 [Burkholderia ubonensis]